MDIQIKVGTIIVDKDSILLQKEWSDSKKNYFWNIIKGTFDDSLDKTISDCAKREAKEEAGIKIKIQKIVSFTVKYGFNIRIYFTFLGKILDGTPHVASSKEQKNRNENFREIKWFTKNEAKKISEKEFVNDVVYEAVQSWLKGETYPPGLLKEQVLNN